MTRCVREPILPLITSMWDIHQPVKIMLYLLAFLLATPCSATADCDDYLPPGCSAVDCADFGTNCWGRCEMYFRCKDVEIAEPVPLFQTVTTLRVPTSCRLERGVDRVLCERCEGAGRDWHPGSNTCT